MLKSELSKIEHGKLDDSLAGLYALDGDSYKLQVEGMTPKSKVDEFRSNNIIANKKIEELEAKYKGINLEQYAKWESTQKALDDKKLIDSGDVEGLIAKRMEAITSDFTGKIDAVTAENKQLKDAAHKAINKTVIQDAAHKAFDLAKIRSESREGVLALINQTFKVEDGVAIARSGEKILTGEKGNLTIGEFVSNQPDYIKEPSSGGGGNGNEGGAIGNEKLTSTQKISAGLKALNK